ncbi:Putative membrane protein [Zobellia galactanivorans]|uniref:Putative membrane protein n=1 Tax=Zobellia galactanivorans (strain DSM 12802 / CCUG 47099 / CIP 106680 / NCIMB 13871 / Dsij) TaxID=63186 RepID=G0L935_ZOBGA|nr:Putative membrane protein [Zobellia galactanivorans]
MVWNYILKHKLFAKEHEPNIGGSFSLIPDLYLGTLFYPSFVLGEIRKV